MELSELFGQLRSLLEQPPSQNLWERITSELDLFEDDVLLEEVVSPYLLSCFRAWPNDLIRSAWPGWYEHGRSPRRKRALHALSTAACSFCKEGRGVDEVKRALKLQHGKRYSSVVRMRDLMTGRAEATWACDACRRFPCPRCEQERTFDEMGAALVRIYEGEGRHPNDLAREIAQQRTGREWACEVCLDGGAVVKWTPPPPINDIGWLEYDSGPTTYSDVTNDCKDCGAEFVFTANEQRVWHQEYGIPRYYEGMYDGRSLITRARCDRCQELHMAQKRIGEILRGGAHEESVRLNLELTVNYVVLGNQAKAAYHRNIARRLTDGG